MPNCQYAQVVGGRPAKGRIEPRDKALHRSDGGAEGALVDLHSGHRHAVVPCATVEDSHEGVIRVPFHAVEPCRDIEDREGALTRRALRVDRGVTQGGKVGECDDGDHGFFGLRAGFLAGLSIIRIQYVSVKSPGK